MDYGTTVTLHSKTGCPFCDEARTFLAERNIPFNEVKHEDPAERQALYDKFGLAGAARTVPQIVVSEAGHDYRIGGMRELQGSGINSLFGAEATLVRTIPAKVTSPLAVGLVVVDEGHPCCE